MSPSSAVYTEDDGLLPRAITFSLPTILPPGGLFHGRKKTAGEKNGRHPAAGSSGSIVTAVCQACKEGKRLIDTWMVRTLLPGEPKSSLPRLPWLVQRPWRTGAMLPTQQKLLSIVVQDDGPVSNITGVPGVSTRKSVDYKSLDPGNLLTLVKTLSLPSSMSCIVRP